MKLNNKGFTLIELLITIALLAVISIISFVSINAIINRNKNNQCISLVNNIGVAAKEYVSDNRYNNLFEIIDNKVNITVQDLINENYLNKEIVNPYTNKVVDATSINVNIELYSDRTVKEIVITDENEEEIFNGCHANNTNFMNGIIGHTTKPYKINYNLGGGMLGINAPSSASLDTVIQIDNPTKTLKIVGHENTSDSNLQDVIITNNNITTDLNFTGWTSTTLGASAQSGATSTSLTVWNGTSTKNKYFKNLRNSGRVTMVANWESASVTLPTITKEGNLCGWSTTNNGDEIEYASGGNYVLEENSSKTVIDLYAVCSANELIFENQTLSTTIDGQNYKSSPFTGASNGTGSYTYTIASGAPTGASINSANRTISFTNTTAASTYNVVVTATDNGSGKTKDATMSITINSYNYEIQNSSGSFIQYATTLASAINGVSSGGSIKVLQNNTSGAVTNTKNITLNTNGKTITLNGTLSNTGTLTINGGGTITAASGTSIHAIATAGSLTTASVSIVDYDYAAIATYRSGNATGTYKADLGTSINGKYGIAVYDGTVNFNAGTINTSDSGIVVGSWATGSASINIVGGSISSTSTHGIFISSNSSYRSTINISSGSVFGYYNGIYVENSGEADINVSGGEIAGNQLHGVAAYSGASVSCSISSGTITGVRQHGIVSTGTGTTTNLYMTGGFVHGAQSGIVYSDTSTSGAVEITGGAVRGDYAIGVYMLSALNTSLTIGDSSNFGSSSPVIVGSPWAVYLAQVVNNNIVPLPDHSWYWYSGYLYGTNSNGDQFSPMYTTASSLTHNTVVDNTYVSGGYRSYLRTRLTATFYYYLENETTARDAGTQSCDSDFTYTGNGYNGCSIQLMSISPESGYRVKDGWYSGDGSSVGSPGASITIYSNMKYYIILEKYYIVTFAHNIAISPVDPNDFESLEYEKINNNGRIDLLYDYPNDSGNILSQYRHGAIIQIKSLTQDGYGVVPIIFDLSKDKKYHFHCDTTGTWGDFGNTVYLIYEDDVTGDINSYIRMEISASGDAEFMPSKNGRYYLGFGVPKDEVTYMFNNITMYEVKELKYGDVYGSLPSPAKSGCAFEYWFDPEKDIRINEYDKYDKYTNTTLEPWFSCSSSSSSSSSTLYFCGSDEIFGGDDVYCHEIDEENNCCKKYEQHGQTELSCCPSAATSCGSINDHDPVGPNQWYVTKETYTPCRNGYDRGDEKCYVYQGGAQHGSSCNYPTNPQDRSCYAICTWNGN